MKKILLASGLSTMLLLTACGEDTTEEMKAESKEEPTETVEESETEDSTAAEAAGEEETDTEEEVETIEDDPNSNEIKELENGTFEIQMAKVEITDTEVLPPNEYADSGKEQLIIHYDVTSKVAPEEVPDTSVSTMNVWMATANATQETDTSIVDLNVGLAPMDNTEYDEALNAQTDTIKKDATVSGIAYYELENRENPVVLEFTQGFMGDSLGTMEIDVSE